jgi:dihydroflavonol-4-reductase
MNIDATNQTVLVTGGSGFIGTWVIIALLRRGYSVSTTIRNLEREASVRAAIAKQVDAGDRIRFFAANLLNDDGWDAAAAGSDFVIHVASPMPVGEYKKIDLLRPAREGTLRVLQAAVRAGVQRVVITSSTSAATPPAGHAGPGDESVWTDLSVKNVNPYARSKTLAEQAAWAFVQNQNGSLTLSTVLPGMVQGPVLGPDYSGSVDLVARMMTGKFPFLPRFGLNTIDVRDLAELHVRAMESAAAAGQRFIGVSGYLWFSEVASILREQFGKRAAKAPTRILPDFIVRLLAQVNADMQFIVPSLGKRIEMSSAKAGRLLDWHPRPAKEAVIASAESLIREGLI